MSFFGGGGFHPRGPPRQQPPNVRFGILPLMRPVGQMHPSRNFMHQPRSSRYTYIRGPPGGVRGGGRFRNPGRGEFVRSGPPKTFHSSSTPSSSSPSKQNNTKEDKAPEKVKENEKDVADGATPIKKESQDDTTSATSEKPNVSTPNDATPTSTVNEKEEENEDVKYADITLDRYNSELHVTLTDNNLAGSIVRGEGFQYMWGGVRGTHGVTKGKVCFEVHLLENETVDLPDEKNPCLARVGWSVDGSDYQLGEDKLSWGYGGTGKSSTDSKFRDYGKPFGTGDVITCYLDMDTVPKAIFYMLNGEYLGVAFRFTNEHGGNALYPHITVKNMKYLVNFGGTTPKFNLTNDFKMLQKVPASDLTMPPPGPTKPQEAEIIMMVGLPGSGKSYWCEKYAEENKEKKFYILGTNLIIDRMRITGLFRKRNFQGRWEELIKRASQILNKLFEVAKNIPHNYILDQTNVYYTARRRKMDSFRGYKRIAAVIVNKPEVLKRRTDKQRQVEGKVIPDEAIMAMKKNFTLPEIGPSFDEIMYLEESKPIAREIIQGYRTEGQNFESCKPSEQQSEQHEKRPRLDKDVTDGPPMNDKRNDRRDSDRRVGAVRDEPTRYSSGGPDRRRESQRYPTLRNDRLERDNRPRIDIRDGGRHERSDSRDRFGRDANRSDRGYGRDSSRDQTYQRRDDDRKPPPSNYDRNDIRRSDSPRIEREDLNHFHDSPHDSDIRENPRIRYQEESRFNERNDQRFPPPQREERRPQDYPDRTEREDRGERGYQNEPHGDQYRYNESRRDPTIARDRPDQRLENAPPLRRDLGVFQDQVSRPFNEQDKRPNDPWYGREREARDYPSDRRHQDRRDSYLLEENTPFDRRLEDRSDFYRLPPASAPSQAKARELYERYDRPIESRRYEGLSQREEVRRSYGDDYFDRRIDPSKPQSESLRQNTDPNRPHDDSARPYPNDSRRPPIKSADQYLRTDEQEYGGRYERGSTIPHTSAQGYPDRGRYKEYERDAGGEQRYERNVGNEQRYDLDQRSETGADYNNQPTPRFEDYLARRDERGYMQDPYDRRDEYPARREGEHARDRSYEGYDRQRDAYPRDDRRDFHPVGAHDSDRNASSDDRPFQKDNLQPKPSSYDNASHRQDGTDNSKYQDPGKRSYFSGEPVNERKENFPSSYSGGSSHYSNDRLSSSYQTQMTTSTANYGHHGQSVNSQSRTSEQQQNLTAAPVRQSDLSPHSSRDRYNSSQQQQRLPPQQPQPPPQGAGNRNSQSYEKQQEDYQKAYSQWYANYAQAYAQLSKQQPE